MYVKYCIPMYVILNLKHVKSKIKFFLMIHGKKGFTEIFINLAEYKSENNFIIF